MKTSVAFEALPLDPKSTMVVPSGVIDVGNWLAGWSESGVPASPCRQQAARASFGLLPKRVDVQTIRRPSGIHIGLISCAGSRFRDVSDCRLISQIEMSFV